MSIIFQCILLSVWIAVLTSLAIHSSKHRRLKLCLVALSGMLMSIWIFIDSLSGNGIDHAVLYHLRAGMKGAGAADFSKPIAALVIALLGCTALAFLPNLTRRPIWRYAGTAFLIVLLPSWLLNPFTRDIASLLKQERAIEVTADTASQYVKPNGRLSNRKNLVILYAESLERTYLDENRFPGLSPELNRLRSEAVDFTQIDSRAGGTWTIAGMISSLCGVPLSLSDDANGYSSISNFMPGARCLSDHLGDQGYNLEFIGGASSDFAGKGRFLASHGFSTTRDKEYFREMQLGSNRFSPWGVHDDVLLDTLWQRFTTLSQNPTPFALVGLTLDTHHPSGHIPFACLDVDYKGLGQRRAMLDAIHCSDRLIADFVRRIKSSPYWENTTIVVASDHLALPNDVSDLLRDAKRTNLLLMFDKDLAARTVDRPATTLDTGATILDAMQGGTALGFGRSQLSRDATGESLTAQTNAHEDQLPAFMAFSKSLWMLGTLKDRVQLVNGVVRLGQQELTPPLAITADENGQITNLGTAGIRSTRPPLAGGTADTLYIDRCFAFDETDGPEDWCMLGSIDGKTRVVAQEMLQTGAPIPELLRSSEKETAMNRLRNDFIIKRNFDASNTVVGQATDGKLFSQFNEGVLAYGPYEDLCAGSYELILSGNASPAAGSWVDVVSEYGAHIFDRFELHDDDQPQGGIIATAPFVFRENLRLSEIRVGVTNQAVVRLDGYSLLPVHETVQLGQKIDFSSAGDGDRYISCGWSGPSDTGRTLRDTAGFLRLQLPEKLPSADLSLTMTSDAEQRLQVLGNGKEITVLNLKAGKHSYRIRPLDPDKITAPDAKLVLMLNPEQGSCSQAGQCAMDLNQLDLLPAAGAP